MRNRELEELAFWESPAPQMVSKDRVIVDCNKSFARLFGYERKELLNQPVLKLYPSSADYYAIGDRCFRWLQNNVSYEDERFMQNKNKEIFWARARGITLTPESPYALMVWSFERIHNSLERTTDLTPREREISGYIVNGLTCKEAAQELGISHRTVELHRGKLMKKLGAKNTAELVSKIIMVTRPEG